MVDLHRFRWCRSPVRQLPDDRRDVRPRRELDDELLDLSLAQMGGSLEDHLVVVRGEERYEPRQAAQMQAAVPQHRQQLWVPACRASDGDPTVGLSLGEVQPLGAVDKHRRARLSGKEPALVDLANVRDQIGFDAVRLSDEISQTAQQIIV